MGTRKLHIGGKIKKNGWEIFNIFEGKNVDHVGNAIDMSRFENDTFDEIYSSHILEHFSYYRETNITLLEWNRILKPKGKLYISVPDLDILIKIFADQALEFNDTFMAMRMMYGGQINQNDFHKVGFNEKILSHYLTNNGFENLRRVSKLEIFNDTSNRVFLGKLISLNMIANKKA